MSAALTRKERAFVEAMAAWADHQLGHGGDSIAGDAALVAPDVASLVKLTRKLAKRLDGRQGARPGKAAQDKGKRWERRVAELLRRVWPDAARRRQDRGAAKDGCDVENTQMWVEAKNDEQRSPWTFWRQAVKDREAAVDPRPILLAITKNGAPELAVVELELLVDLLANQRHVTATRNKFTDTSAARHRMETHDGF